MNRRRRKRSNKRRRQSLMLFLDMLLVLFLIFWIGFVLTRENFFHTKRVEIVTETEAETVNIAETEAVLITEVPETESEHIPCPDMFEKDIYTFLQGPKSWKNKVDWSGSWCKQELAGSVFGEFGCGMCCLANIYSTFSPYDCSPLDMYYYAQEVSTYSPGGGYGAISWAELEKTFDSCGFRCRLLKKDKTYEEFQEEIKHAWTSIVLVSCYNDNKYWETTEGHYVTIWLYDEDRDEVFLGDSGNPDHNRRWIPLDYLYSAMKTASECQYLVIDSYNEEDNTWKHDGITDEWTVPSYYKKG